MQMNGMAELITVAKYWREWADPRLVVAVLNNRDLNLVTWEQRVLEGNPRFDASQDIPDVDYARFAADLGLHGIRVSTPEALGPACRAAFEADRPVVLDVLTDPEVPPLPPHITFEQARMFARSVLEGDPRRSQMIRHALRQKLADVLPRR
jgi:pyruvate dehydrogenase (quinone)